MGEESKIEWCDHTFNPWMGCAKVSEGCRNCYAERDFDHRFGKVKWGAQGKRVRTSAANWKKPLKWNREATESGRRALVFCASLADVFEDKSDQPEMDDWRADLMAMIQATPSLDWLLLTKRPENVMRLLNVAWEKLGGDTVTALPPNVWIGVSVENQEQADKRIPALLKIPVGVRFLSMEPLLGPVDLSRVEFKASSVASYVHNVLDFKGTQAPTIDWVIVGGESGPNARQMDSDWARSIRDQCQAAGVPFFFKQWGEYWPDDQGQWLGGPAIDPFSEDREYWRVGKQAAGRLLDGREWDEYPGSGLLAKRGR
ncbi:MAG: phage Gp37/Gp68 family protein [Anaerolinea sp.]|nr:phage Gp37/Gp68 family protein [Anaerolinea sp.]